MYTELEDGYVRHLLSAIDLKKMIPIKDGVWQPVDLNKNANDSISAKKYKDLLNKEYAFCLKIIDDIVEKATRLYERQMQTGKVKNYCCDFAALEKVCDSWKVPR